MKGMKNVQCKVFHGLEQLNGFTFGDWTGAL